MVEKRASTVEDATVAALNELGVDRDEVDIEVVSEGRRGLFGSSRRAHVRVTVRDAATNGDAPEQKAASDAGGAVTSDQAGVTVEDDVGAEEDEAEAYDDGEYEDGEYEDTDHADEGDEEGPDGGYAADDETRVAQLNEEADLAADFVEGLLDILELPGDIEIEVDESQAFVNVVEVGSGLLIGRRGATLDALQELVRAATQRQVERRSHVRVDIEGYRHRQLEKLKDRCRDGIAQVRETGEPFRLEPMDAYERKVMHDLVARTGGVTSSSEGVEPRRRVVINVNDE
jgi:spoIIIJ-associated protein